MQNLTKPAVNLIVKYISGTMAYLAHRHQDLAVNLIANFKAWRDKILKQNLK